jgi:hypothetical protein
MHYGESHGVITSTVWIQDLPQALAQTSGGIFKEHEDIVLFLE